MIASCVVFALLIIINGVNKQVNAEEAVKYQPHSEITGAVNSFIQDSMGINSDPESLSISVKSLDARLNLSRCEIPLKAFWPPGASRTGHTTVGIRCNDNKPWKLYVSANIKQFKKVWVATTAIARGTVITESHVALDKRNISAIHSEYFDQNSFPVGLEAKRALRAGDVISVLAVEKPIAVKRGERVTVIARMNGLEVRTTAKALNAAAEGDRIKVRNLHSDKELVGILQKNSIVHVKI